MATRTPTSWMLRRMLGPAAEKQGSCSRHTDPDMDSSVKQLTVQALGQRNVAHKGHGPSCLAPPPDVLWLGRRAAARGAWLREATSSRRDPNRRLARTAAQNFSQQGACLAALQQRALPSEPSPHPGQPRQGSGRPRELLCQIEQRFAPGSIHWLLQRTWPPPSSPLAHLHRSLSRRGHTQVSAWKKHLSQRSPYDDPYDDDRVYASIAEMSFGPWSRSRGAVRRHAFHAASRDALARGLLFRALRTPSHVEEAVLEDWA
eukprot:CAMPEP_0181400950 /NCGR_PEP_ID=MMETSP1110-20121109/2385_1 /TAXON_ID=174948 /ORGANISM="Symbiodinium sp., Strain CCMP421" /LENGTH=259 /DNA_ID=CAMNT_0023523077 /DNA_START=522 /DNA_END=1300 /DNA_ORIENTATION=-